MFSPVLLQAAAAQKKVISFEPGLTLADPLPTNHAGITRQVLTKEALKEIIKNYIEGQMSSPLIDIRSLWPAGATSRVLSIVEELVR
jgi:hypothetical protein